MPDSLFQDPGDGAVTPPAHQAETVDVESFLSALTKTETGADSLAKALKDRRTRDILKQRGVKIQADDDIGYNSLPLELRDNIRSFAIADAHNGDCQIRCKRCPRLATYACIDSEWRNAVELFTFRRLRFAGRNEGLTQNLELLQRYTVGSRRNYVQHISLAIDDLGIMSREDAQADELPEENAVDTLTSPIRQLFNCVAQWHECGTGDGNLRVEILTTSQDIWMANQVLQVVPRQMLTGLTNLPTAPQIVHFCTSLGGPIGIRSMLDLLSRMPHLRTLSVLVMPELHEDEQDPASQIQLLYNSLSQTAPNLEGLEVKCCSTWSLNNELHVMFCTASFSFSQRLRKLSFGKLTPALLRTILAPVWTASFSSYAPPPLAWPELTHFTVGEIHVDINDDVCEVINDLMSTVGRVIRYMPRIRHLDMTMSYVHRAQQNNGLTITHSSTKIAFDLQSSRDSHGHIPVGKLCVTHYMDSDVSEAVPSRDVVKLWEKSLSYAANAILEVQVVSRPNSERRLLEIGRF